MKRTSIEWCTHSANPIKFRRAPYVDDAELKAMLSPRRLPAGSRVFVEDMSDLFGEWVPDEMLDRVFAVFALRPDVVFQVLTKRPERMREYLTNYDRMYVLRSSIEDTISDPVPWPLPNVWLGVSAEDQEQADKRIPELLATPAAVRFVSAEPLLGPIDFGWDDWGYVERPDWVIVGGESGPRSRPCDVVWIRAIVAQCRAAGVAVFVKQVGAKPYNGGDMFGECAATAIPLKDRKGGEMAEWAEDLRVREMPV